MDGECDNAFWTKIGAAWEHEDRKGFNILLTAMPLNSGLVIRKPKPQDGLASRPIRRLEALSPALRSLFKPSGGPGAAAPGHSSDDRMLEFVTATAADATLSMVAFWGTSATLNPLI